MKVQKRWKQIEQILSNSGSLSIKELADELHVSQTTIRRDLVKMEENNMIQRLWGGASPLKQELNDTINMQDEYILRFSRNLNIKEKIAKKAASFIKDGDSIFIDAGSTTSFIIDFIEAEDITIVTNSINNFPKLAKKNIRTYVPHGFINFGASAIMERDTNEKLNELNFDIAFLGTNGIDDKAGYTTRNEYDADIKKTVMNRSDQTFIVADSSKFGIKKFYTFANKNDVILITDVAPDFKLEHIILVNEEESQN